MITVEADPLKTINLNSYSSSFGYCGYFYSKNHDFKIGAEAANATVWSFLNSQQAGSIDIYSSLRVGTNAELISQYGYTSIEIERFLSAATRCIPPMVNRLESELEIFSIIQFSSHLENALYGACYAVMALGGLHGHLFIHLKNQGFVLYPHDDTGFGVIALASNKTFARDFLNSIDCEEFEVVRESAGRHGEKGNFI